MLSILLASVVAAQGTTLKDIRDKVKDVFEPKPHVVGYLKGFTSSPTGRNGYEDYMAAADAISPELKELLRWKVRYDFNDATGIPAPSGLSANSSKFDVYRAEAALARPVLELIHAGGQKPVFDPRPPKVLDDTFSEFAALKQMAKLSVDVAAADLAEGNSTQGTRILSDAYLMGRNISRSNMLAYLVGVAVEAIALKGFSDNTDRIRTASDWKQIKDQGKALLAAPLVEFDVVKAEITRSGVLFREFMTIARDDKSSPNSFRTLTDDQITSLVQGAQKRLEAAWLPATRRLRLTEDQWAKPIVEPKERESNTLTPQGMAEELTRGSASLVPGFMGAAIRSRTQLRLLVAHAAIQEYRLTHGNLPPTLQKAGIGLDPLTKRPYVYKVTGGRSYSLASEGTADLGPIELVYRYPRKPKS